MHPAKYYKINWDSYVLTCCSDHIMNCNDMVNPGDIIECPECGIKMILEYNGNELMWSGTE